MVQGNKVLFKNGTQHGLSSVHDGLLGTGSSCCLLPDAAPSSHLMTTKNGYTPSDEC